MRSVTSPNLRRFYFYFAAAILLLVLAVSAAPLHAAKSEPEWQTAKLISLNSQQGTSSGSAQTSGRVNADGSYSQTTTESDWNYVDYQVVIDDGKMLYFGTERLVFRWEHSPRFTENEMVKFSLKGDKLTVIDDAEKKIKLRLVKQRIKE